MRNAGHDAPPIQGTATELTLRLGKAPIDSMRLPAIFGKPNLVMPIWEPRSWDSDRSREVRTMARPAAKDLTERELEVMHVFWKHGEATAAEVRDRLAAA